MIYYLLLISGLLVIFYKISDMFFMNSFLSVMLPILACLAFFIGCLWISLKIDNYIQKKYVDKEVYMLVPYQQGHLAIENKTNFIFKIEDERGLAHTKIVPRSLTGKGFVIVKDSFGDHNKVNKLCIKHTPAWILIFFPATIKRSVTIYTCKSWEADHYRVFSTLDEM